MWYKSMEDRKSVDVLFLDMSKAFDRVPHTYLLDKLRMMGIGGDLLSWLRDYLSSRRQRCIVERCASGWLPVSSGVPKGQFLGHYFSSSTLMTLRIISTLRWLYLLMTVSYIGRYKPRMTSWNCRTISIMWSTKWRMSFNLEKCKVLQVGRIKRQSCHLCTSWMGRIFQLLRNISTLESPSLLSCAGVVISTERLQRLGRCGVLSRVR